jgi:hypothetical protein
MSSGGILSSGFLVLGKALLPLVTSDRAKYVAQNPTHGKRLGVKY